MEACGFGSGRGFGSGARNMGGDGNCYFRSLSCRFTGKETFHPWYRLKIMLYARRFYVASSRAIVETSRFGYHLYISNAHMAGRYRNDVTYWYRSMCRLGTFADNEETLLVQRCFNAEVSIIDNAYRRPTIVRGLRTPRVSAPAHSICLLRVSQIHYCYAGNLNRIQAQGLAHALRQWYTNGTTGARSSSYEATTVGTQSSRTTDRRLRAKRRCSRRGCGLESDLVFWANNICPRCDSVSD